MSSNTASDLEVESPAFDRFSIWGTSVVLGVREQSKLPSARAILEEVLFVVEQAASRFRPDTEIQTVNSSAGRGPVGVSATMADLVSKALDAANITDGACDPTVADSLLALGYDRDFDLLNGSAHSRSQAISPAPGVQGIVLDNIASTLSLPEGVHLDLGATAKARAADLAAERIAEELGVGALVDIGGDLRVCGPAPSGGWIIGVTRSARQHDHGVVDEVIAIYEGGVASSSTVVRSWQTDEGHHHHIIDPKTGLSAETPFAMCTVVAHTCVEANAFSTAGLIWREDAPFELAQRSLPARFVRLDGGIERIGGWPEPKMTGTPS